MSINYTKTTWVNNSAPPINADNLNNMEQGIKAACDFADAEGINIVSLTGTSGTITEAQLTTLQKNNTIIKLSVTVESTTTVYTFVKKEVTPTYVYYICQGYGQILICSNSGLSAYLTWTFSAVTEETTANKVTSLSASSTDTQYPSAKAVYDADSAIKEDISELEIHTKNIFEGVFVQGDINSTGGDTEELKNYFVRTGSYIPVDTSIVQEDNKCYVTLSWYSAMNAYKIYFYDTDKTFISRITGQTATEAAGRKAKFVEVPTTTKYIRFSIYGSGGVTEYTPADVTQPQIEYGYTLTDYIYPWTAYDKTAREAVALKLNSSAVKQVIGTGTGDVMSQNAITTLYKQSIGEVIYDNENAVTLMPCGQVGIHLNIIPPSTTKTTKVYHRNKNLCSYQNSATINTNGNTYFGVDVVLQKGKWYTISYKQAETLTSATHCEAGISIGDVFYIAPKNLAAGTIVFKFQSPVTDLANISIYTWSLSSSITITEFQLEEGEEATSYVAPLVEYQSVTITPTTTYADLFFDTIYSGKNYYCLNPAYGYMTVGVRESTKVLSNELSQKQINWSVAAGDIICIGDSLTDGLYAPTSTGKIKENYPYYIGRLLNATVTNAGKNGGYPSEFYTTRYSSYDFSDYDTVFLWLGTNGGMSINDISTAGTEANYYKLIIDGIKSQKSDIKIVLGTVFVTGQKGSETTYPSANDTNAVIKYFANLYSLPCIDFSDLTSSGVRLLHNMQDNTHFGKTGNIYIANRIVNFLQEYFESDISRCEFGILPKT